MGYLWTGLDHRILRQRWRATRSSTVTSTLVGWWAESPFIRSRRDRGRPARISDITYKGLMSMTVYCGIDWAEEHVRHEASEVERG